MMKNIFRGRGDAARASNGFRGKMAAVLVSGAIGLSACGDEIHNNYYIQPQDGGTDGNVTVVVEPPEVTVVVPSNQPEVSGLCGDAPTIPVLYDKTFNIGESLLLVNGYRLTLSDIEPQTQTAFLHLSDDEGVVLAHVDLPEGVEATIDLGDGPVRASACSVRAGYTFGEKSVTLRADTDIEREASQCGEETFEEGARYTLENGIVQDVERELRADTCPEEPAITIIRETTSLEPGLEAGEGGTGLAVNSRLTVSVLGEAYTIVGIQADGIDFGKESMSGSLALGEALPLAPGYLLRFAMAEEHDGTLRAILDLEDEAGTLVNRVQVRPGAGITITAGGEEYQVHAYEVAEDRAELGVLSSVAELREGGSGVFASGTYRFSMEWGPGNRISGWEFQRE